ncbi:MULTISPECIES: hypothetical protein [Bacillus cereus group]|uniref:Uncharacterized protein n=1 Tax=Bacillus cereus TaxID=1396 RepID=A0AA44QEJ3_BACCE|nr:MULTISPECIES: hypothetical protein [Bacillus cereus group]EEL51364.1 hypothetical protein bcere0022_13240 [Bacillus cereus Rock3-44]PFA25118.1 hypothetical protein CN373_01080 [Bacillus cereus]PFN06282.1 hypothetical protein COJ55_15500 [Bacillus cereus]PFO83170.1 hypothetical protein COJ77_09670 [Bacillus cereus]PFR33161.1 hypothetical protein COK19_00200 [Bacillus cereus]
MSELIEKMALQLILSIPSKKQRIVNKKFKLLRQQKWFQDKYGAIVMFQPEIRECIMNYDIEKMLKSDLEIMIFQKELNGILIK